MCNIDIQSPEFVKCLERGTGGFPAIVRDVP